MYKQISIIDEHMQIEIEELSKWITAECPDIAKNMMRLK
jgi:hypothetical protein